MTRADRSKRATRIALVLAAGMAAVLPNLLFPAVASAVPRSVPDRTWQTNGRVRAIVYRRDTVYLAGDFTRVMSPDGSKWTVRNHAAAFDADTGTLRNWNPNVDGVVSALDVSPDGSTVYLGGDFHHVQGVRRDYVAAVGPGKGTPTEWNPRPSAHVRSLILWKEGRRIFIGGRFTKVNGQTRLHIAKLYTNSSNLVKDWHPRVTQVSAPPIGATCRPRCPANVAALAMSRDGEGLYLGGTFGLVNGVSRNSAAQLHLRHGHTMPWNPNVYSSESFNQVWALAPYGLKVLICGNFWQVGGRMAPNMAVVSSTTGARDRVFVGSTDGAIPACKASKSSPKVLYVGGHFGVAGGAFAKKTGVRRLHLAAFDGVTGDLLGWNPRANSIHGIFAMARTGSRLAIGGDFTETGGRRQAHFAQFSGSV